MKNKKKGDKMAKQTNQGMAILGLILNVLILPGLGTIIGGRTKHGVWQIVLTIIGIPLIFLFGLGFLLMIAMWIWALVDSIQILKGAQ